MDRQHVDVDKLTPHDVDQLSRLIVDALQVVDKDQGQNGGPFQARPGPRDVGGQLTDEEEEDGADKENEEEDRPLRLDPGEDGPVSPAELQGQSHRCQIQISGSAGPHSRAEEGGGLTHVSLFVPTGGQTLPQDRDTKVSVQVGFLGIYSLIRDKRLGSVLNVF